MLKMQNLIFLMYNAYPHGTEEKVMWLCDMAIINTLKWHVVQYTGYIQSPTYGPQGIS